MDQYGLSIQIDPEHMQSVAQAVKAQSEVINNCLASIQTDAAALKDVWEGESADAYQAAMGKLGEESPKVSSIIDEYVLDLNQIALQHMSEEQKLKTKNEALPDDVFGV